MSKLEIIFIGAIGYAHVCIDVIQQHGEFRIAGLGGRPHEVGNQQFGFKYS